MTLLRAFCVPLLVGAVLSGVVAAAAAAHIDAVRVGTSGYCLQFSRDSDIASVETDESKYTNFPNDGFTIGLWFLLDHSAMGQHADDAWWRTSETFVSYAAKFEGGSVDDNTIAISRVAGNDKHVKMEANVAPIAAGNLHHAYDSGEVVDAIQVNGTNVVNNTLYDHWMHTALVFNGPDRYVELYINGTPLYQVSNYSMSSLGTAVESVFVIGQEQDGLYRDFSAAEAFRGCLDDLYIWNASLTPLEVASLADDSSTSKPQPDRLWGAWTFDDIDSSGRVPNQVAGGAALVLGEDSVWATDVGMTSPNHVASSLGKYASSSLEVYVALLDAADNNTVSIGRDALTGNITQGSDFCNIDEDGTITTTNVSVEAQDCPKHGCVCTWQSHLGSPVDSYTVDLHLIPVHDVHLDTASVVVSEATHGRSGTYRRSVAHWYHQRTHAVG